ncbi:MAG: hypothetical protein FJZ09_03765 [Candidatus Omnitrophica bacterium]|nr:hypothetical protein [Candidatus Omnitrophota bacterium]
MKSFILSVLFISLAFSPGFAGGRDRSGGGTTSLVTIPFIYNTVQNEMQGINSATSAFNNMTNTPNINSAPLSSPGLYPEPTLGSIDRTLEYLDYSQQLEDTTEEAAQYNESISPEDSLPSYEPQKESGFSSHNYRYFDGAPDKK